jgi:hypothetical protein
MAGRLRTVASVALISILPALVLTSSAAPQKQSPGPGFDGPWAVSYQDLISDPAASLFYPRSEILQEGGWQEFAELCHGAALMCSPGDVPAFVETQLAVDGLEPQEIFLWYDTELTAMGWRPEASTDNIHTARYAKGEDSQFVLFVDDLPTSQELIGGPDSVLFYSIRYSKGTCPSIDAGCRSHLVPAISDFRRDATMPSSARINFEDLDSRSDAHLFYPGSSLMGSNGYGEGRGTSLALMTLFCDRIWSLLQQRPRNWWPGTKPSLRLAGTIL